MVHPHYFGNSWGRDEARNKSLGSLRIYTDRAVEKKYRTVAEGALKLEKLSKLKWGFFWDTLYFAFLNRAPDWEAGSRIRKGFLEGSYRKMDATSGHLFLSNNPNSN